MINENNEHLNEINDLKKEMNNNDKINKMKITEYEKEIDFLKNRIDEMEKENENLKNIANDLKQLSYENKDKYEKLNDKYNNDVDELNKYINNLKKEFKNLGDKNKDNDDNNNDLIEQNKINEEKIYNLKTQLFYLLLQNYIDKNIIFDKRKFLNLLLERNCKQNLRKLRIFNEENDRKYRTADNSSKNIFKSKSKEKKYEMLRSSFKRELPY